MQTVFIEKDESFFQLDLPDENQEVLTGVNWGSVLGFPSVSFWLYKVLERRVTNKKIEYKLGSSLLEETGACLLGGHGIPAEMGLAAFDHLREKGIFNGDLYDADHIESILSQPIINKQGKKVKYRFAKQKSKYISSAISHINSGAAPVNSGKELRDWLLKINGVGPKTASWIARNWIDADDVAILDIHILRAGVLGGFFPEEYSVEKNYFDLESIFIELAGAMHVRASELDAVIWYEMQRSSLVHDLLKSRKIRKKKKASRELVLPFSYKGCTDPYKLAAL